MCLCSITFLFNTSNINTSTPFHTLATEVVKENNIEMVIIKYPIQTKYEKDKSESDRIKAEKLKQEYIEEQKRNELQWQ